MYHHVGASLYLRISLMWMSGFSVVLLRYCFQICLRLCRYVYTTSEEMAAKDSPYDMANVVLLGQLGTPLGIVKSGVPDEQWGVVLIRLFIECEPRCENTSRIIGVASVVVRIGVAHGQELAIPRPIEMKHRGENTEETDHTNQCVGDGMPDSLVTSNDRDSACA